MGNWNRKERLTALSFVAYTDLLDLAGQYWHETTSAWNTLQWNFSRASLLCLTVKGKDERERRAVFVHPGICWHLSYFSPSLHKVLSWYVLDMPSLGDNVYATMGLSPRGSVYRNCLFMLIYLKTVLYPELAVITPSFVLLLTLTN